MLETISGVLEWLELTSTVYKHIYGGKWQDFAEILEMDH